MTETIKMILEFGFMTVFSGITLYLLAYFVKRKIDEKSLFKHIDMRNHEFFSYLTKMDNQLETWTICPKNKLKDIALKKMIKIKIKHFKQGVPLIFEQNVYQIDRPTLLKTLMNNLFFCIKGYEKEAYDVGLPPILIKAFNTWHAPHVEVVSRGIERFCQDQVYINNKSVINSAFYEYITGFDLTFIDIKLTAQSINGEFDKWLKENSELVEKWEYEFTTSIY